MNQASLHPLPINPKSLLLFLILLLPLAPHAAAPNTAGFQTLQPHSLGIDFIHSIDDTLLLKNRILENGSGVAAGDYDNDGLCDFYFCQSQGPNALYKNLGNWNFTNTTSQAAVGCENQFSTGACFADLNGDGFLDLLVNGLGTGTRLFLNQKNGTFKEKKECGLLTHTAAHSLTLADVDQDQDLDLYVTHYQTATWKDLDPKLQPKLQRTPTPTLLSPTNRFRIESHADGSPNLIELGEPDTLYLNDGSGTFTPLPWTTGHFLNPDNTPLTSPPTHWGLSARFLDTNNDHLPDLYICNDFAEAPDQLWIHQGNLTWKNLASTLLPYTSLSSMAVDSADLNLDGWQDLFIGEMLSPNPQRQLTQTAPESLPPFQPPLPLPSHTLHQIQANTLFLNRGPHNPFAEIAHYSGIEATEWTWNVAFLDIDLDGYDDLLIANGNRHDLMDADGALESMFHLRQAPPPHRPPLTFFPPLHLPNLAYRNQHNLTFQNQSQHWNFHHNGITIGLCLADLDQDHDLDLILNNFQAPPLLYRNQSNQPRIAIRLQASSPNPEAIGATLRWNFGETPEGNPMTQTRQLYKGGRYLSSDQTITIFAAPNASYNPVLRIDWPNGTTSQHPHLSLNQLHTLVEPTATSTSDAIRTVPSESAELQPLAPWFQKTDEVDLNPNGDLLPLSQEWTPHPLGYDSSIQTFPSPQLLAVQRNEHTPIELLLTWPSPPTLLRMLAEPSGKWKVAQTLSLPHPIASLAFSPNADSEGTPRLLLALHHSPTPLRSQPSILTAEWKKDQLHLTQETLSGHLEQLGQVLAKDLNRDGIPEVIAPGRRIPSLYPQPATTRLYRFNNTHLRLAWQESLAFHGLGNVTGTAPVDIDHDGDLDLLFTTEWGTPRLFLQQPEGWQEVSETYGLNAYQGLWQGLLAADFNLDGETDFLAFNWGTNHLLQRSLKFGIQLWYGDLDQNGHRDTLLARLDPVSGKWHPLLNLLQMGERFPILQTLEASYTKFAKLDLSQIFTALASSRQPIPPLTLSTLQTTLFIQTKKTFQPVPLPPEIQGAPTLAACLEDFDKDHHPDLLLFQPHHTHPTQGIHTQAMIPLLLKGNSSASRFTFLDTQKQPCLTYAALPTQPIQLALITLDKHLEIYSSTRKPE